MKKMQHKKDSKCEINVDQSSNRKYQSFPLLSIFHGCLPEVFVPSYALGFICTHMHIWKKGCCTPIWGNTLDMNRVFVLPVDWNWHEMYLWLLPKEIRSYLGQTFTSMLSGIIEVQNCSLGCHFSKSAFALWQDWMNNFKFFSILTNCSNNDMSNPYRY